MPLYLKLVLAVLIVAAVEVAWLTRWEVIPFQSQDMLVAFQLDRWTGHIYVIASGERWKIEDKK